MTINILQKDKVALQKNTINPTGKDKEMDRFEMKYVSTVSLIISRNKTLVIVSDIT